MSERFTFGPLGIYDTWHRCPADQREVCDLLNRQAEQIEVLREMISQDSSEEDEIAIIELKEKGDWRARMIHLDRFELAKARIAALEGK